MVKNIEVEHLVINKLTQEQFDNIEEKNPTELYFVTDAETLPDQSGNTGKFLTTDGENVSWANVDAVTQTDLDLKADKSSVYDKTEVGDLLKTKQDILTPGSNIIIVDNVISSTAQESFFRGRWETWEDVPSNAYSYPEDLNGNRTPTTNDYMVVVDASQYTPDMNDSVVISKDKNSHYIIINGVSVGFPNQIKTYTYDTVTYTVENTSGGMVIKLYADKTVQYREQIIPAGATIIITTYSGDAIEPANLYYSKLDNLSGAWRFGYKGVWAVDNQSGWKPEYQIEDTLPMATETQAGINKTYTAGVNIRIEDNVISSTAQESFFRGRYKNWDTVPTNGQSYPNDIYGNHIPSNTDYIIIEDSSTVPGGQVEVQMTMETDRYSTAPTQKLETVVNGITYNGTGVFDNGNIEVFCNTDGGNYTVNWKTLKNSVEYQGKTYEAGSVFFKVIIKPENNITQNAKLSLGNPYIGSWRFSYRGAWDLDNRNGWKAEYQIEEVMPIATETQIGIAKLYTTSGSNIDGAMTQKAVGDAISVHNTATNAHSDIRGVAGGLATLDNNAKVPMSQINDALIGNVSYQGLWDATSNTPFLADPTGGLPAGYKALGYIDFKSETFIDTGVFIDETDETVEYDIKMTPERTSCFPFGAAGSNAGANNTGSLFFNSGTIEYFAGGTRGIRLGEVITGKDYIINIKLDQTTQTVTVIENDLRTSQTYAGSIISPVPIILGGLYYGTSDSPIRNFNYVGKIYYFIIRKNGQTVKQYQPAQRISDGAYGFYEQVSGEFVVSSGTSFSSGGGEIKIPKGYYYITTVAGDRFGLHFDVGDWIISAGGYWSKVDNTDAVSAVNGMTGNVILNATDINTYNKTEIDDKFTESNAQISANAEAISDTKDDMNDLQMEVNTKARVIIRRWN
jgi:hypothetical protein